MKKTMTFEAAMKQLQEIVDKLEQGNESLDASLKLFEQGSALTTFCYEKLHHAEQKIREISQLEPSRQAGEGGGQDEAAVHPAD